MHLEKKKTEHTDKQNMELFPLRIESLGKSNG